MNEHVCILIHFVLHIVSRWMFLFAVVSASPGFHTRYDQICIYIQIITV